MGSNAAKEPEKVDDVSPKEMQLEHTASDSLDELHPHQQKELIRKIDWRLLPMLGALYAIALIDRINVCYNHVSFEAGRARTTDWNRYRTRVSREWKKN
jgi:hypothetical protein